ncbi:MAG: hypothetical protein PHP23_12050 [Desulfobacterales bacterium]|nr:hypothetical protein [Desulfobacterales bacterium]MDD4072272.1 hypothetical protein [Desulfobacterales bacterium]MDD4392809.1 hypothetical protein [Desulfobacterales bacterium]
MHPDNQSPVQYKIIHAVYGITVFFLSLSGFAQMPIFKRYYIADIPGLGWLARFYATHYIHYLGAILLLGLLGYLLTDYLLLQRNRVSITVTGFIRSILIAGIVLTGSMLVVKNLGDFFLSPSSIVLLDLCHLGFAMAFLTFVTYCRIFRKRWTIIQ